MPEEAVLMFSEEFDVFVFSLCILSLMGKKETTRLLSHHDFERLLKQINIMSQNISDKLIEHPEFRFSVKVKVGKILLTSETGKPREDALMSAYSWFKDVFPEEIVNKMQFCHQAGFFISNTSAYFSHVHQNQSRI